MLLGFEMDILRVMVVSVLGGLLGILMMIPLRRAFIVNMHGKPGEPNTLLYPEGTACAEVLISGEEGGASGQTVFIGFGIAFLVKFVIEGMTLLRLTVNFPLKFFNRVAVIATDMAPELLGVGYVIGARVASIMMAGAVIGNLVIVPAIATFGDQLTTVIAPGDKLIHDMNLGEIQKNYLRFIGAGCVTAAGIISMMRTLPLVIRSFRSSLGSLRGAGGGRRIARTDRDLSGKAVLIGSAVLLALLAVFLVRELTLAGVSGALIKGVLGAGLVLIFGFLFVTVSSRLTGEIGSSSNPISGMTVATLALTCLIFLTLGMTSPVESVVALSIGGVVCIAASNGGTTSQDLKTGYLVGATPIYQQWAILIGAVSSALVIGFILLLFNQAGTVYSRQQVPNIVLSERDYDALTDRQVFEGTEYRIWHPQDVKGVKPGKYLVDANRKPAVLEDPAITGRLEKRDDDSDVKMKFECAKDCGDRHHHQWRAATEAELEFDLDRSHALGRPRVMRCRFPCLRCRRLYPHAIHDAHLPGRIDSLCSGPFVGQAGGGPGRRSHGDRRIGDRAGSAPVVGLHCRRHTGGRADRVSGIAVLRAGQELSQFRPKARGSQRADRALSSAVCGRRRLGVGDRVRRADDRATAGRQPLPAASDR